MPTAYSSLTVTIPADDAEFMTDLLAELGTIGCELRGEDPVTITAYFEGGDNLDAVERVIRSRLGDACLPENSLIVERGVVPQADWETVWRQSLHPMRVGRSWVVRPPWIASEGFPNRETLVIDPKMGFGTGTHATTRLCLIELEDLVRPGMSVLDVGTGTGILAIAAAKLGAQPVVGVEIDPVAVQCATENLALNDMTGHVELVTGTLADLTPRREGWDLIVANIEYRTLVAFAPAFRARIRPAGLAILSGILQLEAQHFLRELRRAGWRPIRLRRRFDPMTNDGWVCCVAARIGGGWTAAGAAHGSSTSSSSTR